VVVTGAWLGGRLDLDVWPPVRPAVNAKLQFSERTDAIAGLTVDARPQPVGNPNHVHLTLRSIEPEMLDVCRRSLPGPECSHRGEPFSASEVHCAFTICMTEGFFGAFHYHPSRRFAATFDLSWAGYPSGPPPPPTGKPNLVIPTIDNVENLSEFGPCRVTFTVADTGTGDASATHTFVRVDQLAHPFQSASTKIFTGALAAAERRTQQASLPLVCPPPVRATVTADADMTVAETNETDNTTVRDFLTASAAARSATDAGESRPLRGHGRVRHARKREKRAIRRVVLDAIQEHGRRRDRPRLRLTRLCIAHRARTTMAFGAVRPRAHGAAIPTVQVVLANRRTAWQLTSVSVGERIVGRGAMVRAFRRTRVTPPRLAACGTRSMRRPD
jgi:hypothetical protein